jgi:GNAT superfamily N-acetyltransferase
VNFTSLQPEHLEDAARLVAARYAALRGLVPSLPSRYEDGDTIAGMLHELGQSPGLAAFEAGRLVGFLTGFVLPELLGKRSFYSPEWANGVQPGNSRRIYEEMYGHISARWIADGCAIHAVTLMTNDREGVEAWQCLGFGLAGVDGVRNLSPVPGGSTELDVRQAGPRDVEEVTAFGRALEQHLAAPPAFWIHGAEDYGAWLEQPHHAAWLAYEGGAAAGCLGLELGSAGGCDIVRDEKTAGITLAYTRQSARCRGISTALLNHVLAWARDQGYLRCAADWEAMNPPANRFWTRRFDVVCYSLTRSIDERLVARSAAMDRSQDRPLGRAEVD